MAHVFVLGDSLTFHGPEQAENVTDPRLWLQHMSAALGDGTEIDLVARVGWTMRDGWWAITKDPVCWGVTLPRADAVVIALGGMDQLPAAIPTYLREGIAYVRPGAVRRRVRATYAVVAPRVIAATGGPLRQLPQKATDTYFQRIVNGIRYWRPLTPIVLLGPSPFNSPYYPSARGHAPAVHSARAAALASGVEFVDLDPLVAPSLADGTANPDGMHWSWSTHVRVGRAVADTIDQSWESGRPRGPAVPDQQQSPDSLGRL